MRYSLITEGAQVLSWIRCSFEDSTDSPELDDERVQERHARGP